MSSLPGTAGLTTNTSRVLSVIMGGGAGHAAVSRSPRSAPSRPCRSPASTGWSTSRSRTASTRTCKRIYLLTQFNSASLHRHISQSYKFDQLLRRLRRAPRGRADLRATRPGTRAPPTPCARTCVHLLNHDFDYVLILSGDQLYRMDFRHDHRPARRDGRRSDDRDDSRSRSADASGARHHADRPRAAHHAVRREAEGSRRAGCAR